jgi:SAM-dependent methyltransferase
MRTAGYDAAGIDPEAPDGPWYERTQFERYQVSAPVRAVVASTSLHHLANLGEVLDLVAGALVPGGRVVVVEWARERLDEATARWCFDRLRAPPGEHNWLRERREEWSASGLTWDDYCRGWAADEGLHAGADIVRELDARFGRRLLGEGPYFFADLAGVSEADEQAAIDAGEIQAGRIAYVGRR